MKKRTNPPSVLARLRAAVRTFARSGPSLRREGGYESARISAELHTIAERRSTFDR